MLTWKVWDELVFPAPLTEPSAPHKSNHLSYILGHMVDLGGLDSPEDIPQMDRFGECHREPMPVPSAAMLHARGALHDEEEVMEQETLEEERECSEYTEEVDSPVSSPWNSTDSDRHTEEEDEGELPDKPTGEPADGPMDETAVKLAEGHPPDDELAEGHLPDDELTEDHPPGNELAEGHPPDYEPAGTITVECLTLGHESPPGGTQEEDRVVIHASEDEMDRLC